MSPRIRDAERTKAAILAAARRLLAERDVSAVSIRDVAAAAGVSHGLVQHHFGTREQLVAAVVREEIERFVVAPLPLPGRDEADLEVVRRELGAGLARFRDYALVIMRAELAGAEPERLLDPAVPTPAKLLADSIRDMQSRTAPGADMPDPNLVSAYVNAALFAFAAIAPWLMASVGLAEDDYEARLDEIIDISIRLISLASGVSAPAPRAGR